MYILKYKNLDAQRTVCCGFTGSGTSVNNLTTGISDTYGMDSALLSSIDRLSGQRRSKLFGIEDIYGTRYQWLANILSTQNKVFVYWGDSLVESVADFNGDSLKGYTSEVFGTTKAGFLPTAVNGSNTTYYTDWAVLYPSSYCIVGGDNTGGNGSGLFCIRLGEKKTEEEKTYDKSARIMYL